MDYKAEVEKIMNASDYNKKHIMIMNCDFTPRKKIDYSKAINKDNLKKALSNKKSRAEIMSVLNKVRY